MPSAIKVEMIPITEIADELLKFAVIACRHQGQWVYCRHKERSTWEIPGGRREANETILETAGRELYEETGATEFDLQPLCVYYVEREQTDRSYGLLCYADIKSLGALPESEIEQIQLVGGLPEALTYPLIQPHLYAKVQSWLGEEGL